MVFSSPRQSDELSKLSEYVSGNPIPHHIPPFHLIHSNSETISTGHRANIFSAKFLPYANTPRIVSVAGDRDVRVYDVESLGRRMGEAGDWELDGVSGEG